MSIATLLVSGVWATSLCLTNNHRSSQELASSSRKCIMDVGGTSTKYRRKTSQWGSS